MGDRYVATGIQLGVIKALVESGSTTNAVDLIDSIIDKQYIGYSSNSVELDAQYLSRHDIFDFIPKPDTHTELKEVVDRRRDLRYKDDQMTVDRER